MHTHANAFVISSSLVMVRFWHVRLDFSSDTPWPAISTSALATLQALTGFVAGLSFVLLNPSFCDSAGWVKQNVLLDKYAL